MLNTSRLGKTVSSPEPSITQRKIIIKHLREEGIENIDGASTGEEALKS